MTNLAGTIWDRHGVPRIISGLLVPMVTALAMILRFDALARRGLLYWDEGKFALEGLRLLAIAMALQHGHPVSNAGKTIGTAKPTHALLIAVSYALLGVHDYAPLYLDATCSVAGIPVLYMLGKRLFGPGTGLLAALLLAVSEYDVLYARSALSESDANLFFLLGTLVWITNHGYRDNGVQYRRRFLAGLLLGVGVTINYRLSVYVASLVVFDLIDVLRRDTWRETAGTACSWACGGIAILASWQVAALVADAHGLVLFQSEITHQPTSYIAEVLYQIHGGRQSRLGFNPLPYIQWFVARQGLPVSLLVLMGLIIALRRRSFNWTLPAVLVAVPYAVYCFAPFIVPRNLDTAVPFTSLLAAATLVTVARSVKRPCTSRLLLVATALLLAVFGGSLSWRLTAERSGFALAAHYLQGHHADGALVNDEVLAYYIRDGSHGCDAPHLTRNIRSLAAARDAGYGYAVVYGYDPKAAPFLNHHARLAAHFLAAGTDQLGENPIATENGLPPGAQNHESVNVYRLDRIPGVKPPDARVACSLDQVE